MGQLGLGKAVCAFAHYKSTTTYKWKKTFSTYFL